ncbi:MAG: excalibur calcium-binding domain-containing protein [Corynebacterium sp.]|uniref:excalibur calcium-binding domain-containing protein n=1 Tax=Corynebacterium sp. TaxID=1720 RepID=UPI0026DB92C6|nr:excalibur calcium-binding domain-containing protein [Corynebacterium sp.]MDO5097481.1 excalibur calcium-binding domain-containing protein [Corynebacterium sp.]
MNVQPHRSLKTHLSCIITSSIVAFAALQSPVAAQTQPPVNQAPAPTQPTQPAPQPESPAEDSGSSASSAVAELSPGEIAAIATTGVVVVGFIGTAAGWAISEGIIPNPLPGVIHIGPNPNQTQPGQQKAQQQQQPVPKFKNCDEVAEAFNRRGPYFEGDPAYQAHLDRNRGGKNGVACEEHAN